MVEGNFQINFRCIHLFLSAKFHFLLPTNGVILTSHPLISDVRFLIEVLDALINFVATVGLLLPALSPSRVLFPDHALVLHSLQGFRTS